jgi:metal-dependent amidase/aminoacylase/carboxypeptidase family protein
LLSFGVEEHQIKRAAGTGLVVDIHGTGEGLKVNSEVKAIALRADMDGLPMPEAN